MYTETSYIWFLHLIFTAGLLKCFVKCYTTIVEVQRASEYQQWSDQSPLPAAQQLKKNNRATRQ